jgi:Glycosyl transferase family 2
MSNLPTHEAMKLAGHLVHGTRRPPSLTFPLHDFPPNKRHHALLTVARDEGEFLTLWVRYYRQFFAPEDIYVCQHMAGEDSRVWQITQRPDCKEIPVYHPTVDWGWHAAMLQYMQHYLLHLYDMVLVTDVDEIVAPDPRTGTLGDYLARFEADYVHCRGYEVLHLRDREPPLDFSQPILTQRDYWYANPIYSKPLLARIPLEWYGGMRLLGSGRDTQEDPSLVLLHLHRVDYDTCLARHQHRAAQAWDETNIREGYGYQNRIAEPEAFAQWFYGNSCGNVPIAVKRIPAYWKGVI